MDRLEQIWFWLFEDDTDIEQLLEEGEE